MVAPPVEVTHTPRPSAKKPVVPVVPAPEPVAAATPAAPPSDQATVSVEGAPRAVFVDKAGKVRQPGTIPPGEYTLQVFWDGANPEPAITFSIGAGETRAFHCKAAATVCR